MTLLVLIYWALKFAPGGANSFLQELTLTWKSFAVQRSKQEVTKVIPLLKRQENRGVPIHLKTVFFFKTPAYIRKTPEETGRARKILFLKKKMTIGISTISVCYEENLSI